MVLRDCIVYCIFFLLLSILHIVSMSVGNVCVLCLCVRVCVCVCVCVLHMCMYVCVCVRVSIYNMIYILLIDCAENILKFCFIFKIILF